MRFLPFLLILCLGPASCRPKVPEVTVSATAITPGDVILVTGKGFSPGKHVLSHLRRPDQTEYEILRFVVNDKGEYSHTILTQLFMTGTYELWAIDEATEVASGVVRIQVGS